jgi:tripartite-type tricarboxylate transporter receptor subunit TctC
MSKVFAFLIAVFTLASSPVSAQPYPSKHITLIVPFAAGGSNDIVGRAVGKKLTEAWGQPVVIENHTGAGGVIGASVVAAAPPDGYTLLLVSSTFTINAAIRNGRPAILVYYFQCRGVFRSFKTSRKNAAYRV